MSQQNFKKQTNALTFIPDEDFLALFYSTDLDAWAYKNENGDVQRFVSETTKARSLFARVRNQSGSTINALNVVYISGTSGTLPLIEKAQGDSSSTSDKTFAVMAESIPNNNDSSGAIAAGLIEDVDTSAFVDGDLLWLSPTIAGAITNVRPTAPDHSVFIGYVIKSHPTNGAIQVSIKNGFQLEELHNVLFTSLQNKNVLKYDSATQLWKNGTLDKTEVGLANVDNTSDLNKAISTATQTALDLKANLSLIGANNGIAGLDSGGKVPASQLPSFVDDVIEAANFAALPVTGETGKIYVTLDNNKTFRWSGSAYVEISASPGSTDAVTEGVTNLYFTEDRVRDTVLTGLSLLVGTAITAADSVRSALGKLQKQISDNLTTLTNHIANVSNPHAVTKTQVGLGNVQDVDTTTTSNILEGSNLYFLPSRVLLTVLTGFAASTNTAIAATDNVLQALQKTQAQINARALSSITISAGTSLNGGGDLTANRTINHNNFGTAGTYGSASSVPVITTEATGHVSGVTNTPIAILAAAVTDFAAAVRAVLLTGITFPYDTAVAAGDSILAAIGKLQGQIDVWTELITTTDVISTSTVTLSDLAQLDIPVVAGRTYRYELTLVFESTVATTGIAVTVATPDGAAGNIAMTARMITAADGTAAEHAGAISALGDLVISPNVPAINTRYVCDVIGMFVCTTGGTLRPQFRREAAGTNVTVRAGSCILSREFQ